MLKEIMKLLIDMCYNGVWAEPGVAGVAAKASVGKK